NTGAVVRDASSSFNAHAAVLARSTTFSAGQVNEVQTLLLSYRNLTGHLVQDATPAVLDLATRMGMDAPAAAKLLGKALSDPEKGLSALAKAGVAFSDAERQRIAAMLETG